MRIGRPMAITALAAASFLVTPPAFAAPPANDVIGGAVAASIGFSQVLDTTEATTDADDAQLNLDCGAPATDASVWYTFTSTSDTGVVVDVSQSSYSAGVLVGVGSPGSLDLVACGPGTVGFLAEANTTYFVLAIDDQLDGSGNGGTLNISFNEAPPPPSVELTVDPVGRVNGQTGTATLTGTYTCTNGDFIDIFGDMVQTVGRASVTGFFEVFDEGTCDGTEHEWVVTVFPDRGKFAGGKTATVTFAFSCGPFECAESFVEQTVKLRGGGQ
jgi:Family of unknown function (DUF6299)